MRQPNDYMGIGMLLAGEDRATVDDKGRILLPKSIRASLGDIFVLRIGRLGCLEAMHSDVFVNAWREIEQYSAHSDARREYAALFFSLSYKDIKPDSTGRCVIPPAARERCQLLNTEAVIRPAGDVVEIWNAEEYEKYKVDKQGYNREFRDMLEQYRKAMVAEGKL